MITPKKISQAKFARICVEIDLSKPLKRGFWIGDEEHRSMVVVFYERLLVFYFKCGLIGHGETLSKPMFQVVVCIVVGC